MAKMLWHWRLRRKGYERVNGSGRRRTRNVQQGSSPPERQKRRGFFWPIKIKPKFKFLKMASPKKLLACLRDAYVKMMLGFANSQVATAGVWGGGEGINPFGKTPQKEYDDKVIIEIYKSVVVAQAGHQLISQPPSAADSARFGGLASNVKLAVIIE